MNRFNTELLVDRRIRSGHSTLSLAGHLGMSAASLRAIEGGADPDRYRWKLLRRYAEALGLEPMQLFVIDDDVDVEAVSDDVAQVVAVVVAAGGTVHVDVMAETLDWSPERVRLALHAASRVLPAVGLRLVWFGDSAVEMLPDAKLSASTATMSVRSVEAFGLQRDSARLVWQLMSKVRLSRSSNPVKERQLVDAGMLVYDTDEGADVRSRSGVRAALRLSKQARFDLCLDVK